MGDQFLSDAIAHLICCPLCGLQEPDVTKQKLVDGDYNVYDCPRCGNYKISRTAETMAAASRWKQILPLVSAQVRECFEYEGDRPFVHSETFKSMEDFSPDRTDGTNIHRLLKYIENKTQSPGSKVPIVEHFDYPIVWGDSVDSLRYYMSYLVDNKFITYLGSGGVGDSFAYEVRLEILGRNRLDEISTLDIVKCVRTKWSSVNEYMDAAYDSLTKNPITPYYKNCAHSCREAIVALANAVYDKDIHGDFEQSPSSYSNALNKLDLVVGELLKGGRGKEERSMAKAAIGIANKFAHAEIVSLSQALNCYSSAKAVIEVVNNSIG